MSVTTSIKRPGMSWVEFDAKAMKILSKLQEHLLPEHKDEIIAIEPFSGDYFLGKTSIEATEKARAKHPDKIFFTIRVDGGPVIRFRRSPKHMGKE